MPVRADSFVLVDSCMLARLLAGGIIGAATYQRVSSDIDEKQPDKR